MIVPPTSESAEIAAWVIIVPIVIGVLVINVIVIAFYFVSPALSLFSIYEIYFVIS